MIRPAGAVFVLAARHFCYTVYIMSVRKIFYNTLFQSLGKLISITIGLIVVGLLTRYLDDIGFGEYSTVTAFMGFCGVLADLGLYLVATKEISHENADEKKILGNVFALRIITVVSLLAAGSAIAQFFPYSPRVKEAMFLGILTFSFVSGTQVLIGVFQKHLVFYQLVASEVAGRLIMLATTILFIRWHLGLLAFILSLTFANAAHFLISLMLARRIIPFRLQFDFGFWKEILTKSWPLAFSVIFNLIYFKGDAVVLSLFRPPQDVGLYGLAYKFLEVPLAFPAMFAGLIMPFLARFAFYHWEDYRLYLQKSVDAILLIVVPLVVGVYFFSGQILDLVGGGIYPEAAHVLQILIFATAIIYIGQLFGYAVVALNQQRTMQWGYLAGAIVGMMLYFLLIPRFSYWGAAWATVAVEALVATFAYIVTSRAAGFYPSFSIINKALAAGVPMALFYRIANLQFSLPWLPQGFVHILSWASEAGIGLIIYFFLLYMTGAIPKDFLLAIYKKRGQPGTVADIPA